ncbi:MAG: hypothetical protein JST36_01790 [Bacteroidetes bacterium]|nr:hypothetical protein [Bacteroidota bacterium]
MIKTLIYLTLFALLGFGVWFFLFSDKSDRTYNAADAGFGVRDTASIGKIFLAANNDPNTILLERKPEGWLLNGKYPVLKSTLDQLLNTIRLQEPLFPVPDNQRNSVIKGLAGAGIKTEIYDVDGRKIRTFYVGGEMGKFAGTAMLMDGSEIPYVVQIPGFEGYLTTRYSTNLNNWRDRLVFDYTPDQIAEIKVEYPLEPLNSFDLKQQNGNFTVTLDSAMDFGQKPLNVSRAKTFLGLFKKIYNEGYVNGFNHLNESLKQMPPRGYITITDTKGQKNIVKVYYFPIDERSKNFGKEVREFSDNFNPDRYYAVMNGDKDTTTVQVPTFSRIFRLGYEFFMADDTTAKAPQVTTHGIILKK